IELRATYDNADSMLVPGQLVNVVVELNRIRNALIIPHDAITAGPDGQYVYAIADGRARQVPIKVLFDDSKNVAVTADLEPGEQVVTDGQMQVVPGGAVDIVRGIQAGGGGHRGGGKKP